jgi:two-component system chemotaxis sensor kinase CheA
VDLAKYRTIFIEESTEHFAEMSSALLELEKNPASAAAIDVVFRMAHSVKGMAASLGYDSITEVAHRLEDRMQVIREDGRVAAGEEMSLLFRGLEALEGMVEAVVESGETPAADAALLAALSGAAAADRPVEPDRGGAEKKVKSP